MFSGNVSSSKYKRLALAQDIKNPLNRPKNSNALVQKAISSGKRF